LAKFNISSLALQHFPIIRLFGTRQTWRRGLFSKFLLDVRVREEGGWIDCWETYQNSFNKFFFSVGSKVQCACVCVDLFALGLAFLNCFWLPSLPPPPQPPKKIQQWKEKEEEKAFGLTTASRCGMWNERGRDKCKATCCKFYAFKASSQMNDNVVLSPPIRYPAAAAAAAALR